MRAEILEELKTSFHMKKNHIQILKLLSAEECTADEICERTGIPKGRIYNLLNELIDMQIIERGKGTPAVYSMRNPNDKVLDFLRYEFNKEVQKQSSLLSKLEEKSTIKRVDIVTNSEDYDYAVIGLMSEAKWIKAIHRGLSIAWFIQPRNEAEFWRIRQEINKRRIASTTPNKEISILKYRSYMELYDKKPVEHILTKEALEFYAKTVREVYGKKKVGEWAKEILEDLERRKNVRIFIIDRSPTVFTIYISDSSIISILIDRGEVSGMKILSRNVSEIYEKYFEELKGYSKPIQEYLRALM